MDGRKNFGVVDMVVFVGLLLSSTSIGIFFAFKDRNKSSTSNYYYGGGKMNPLAVGLSLSVTYVSSLSVLALPAEVYIVGTSRYVTSIGILLVALLGITYFIPAYWRLDIATVNEYLELRFNATARRLSAVLTTLNSIVYVATNIYLPSLAISAVTDLSFEASVALCATICTFYTTVGGMKTVVWTDVLQSLVMIAGMASVLFKTLSLIGGFGELNAALDRGERLLFAKPDFDIRSRTSTLNIFFSNFIAFFSSMNFTQSVVQRFQSCKSVRSAQFAMAIFAVPTVLLQLIATASGCVMYAYFEGCDPVESGKLQSLDQGLPYLSVEVFAELPGMAGLFVAAIFSGSLSTASSVINSLSVVFVRDFVAVKWTNLSDRMLLIIGKIAVVGIGGIMMAFAYLFPLMQSNIVKIISIVLGMLDGPLLGLFLLGFFCPWASAKGSISGAIVGFAFSLWVALGAMVNTIPPHAPLPPTSTELCPVALSNHTNTTQSPVLLDSTHSHLFNSRAGEDQDGVSSSFDQMLYSISFLHYMPLATAITIVFGVILSLVTGPNDPSKIDPTLFIPLVDNPILPTKVRKFFRFGVPEISDGENKTAHTLKYRATSPQETELRAEEVGFTSSDV